MPKVSIVIPAYNAMKYLPETLESVFRQTYDDYEIVIVNDGSKDNIFDWITQLNSSKIILVSQENQGLAGARNTGIQNSTGEYIAILDADDLWDSTKLAKQVHVLDEFPSVGLVYTWTALTDEFGYPTGRFFKMEDEGNVWEKLIISNIVGGGSVPLIRRCCFEKVGLFDCNLRSFVEDWDLWLRIAPHFEFKVVKEVLVYYRQLPSSASRNWEAMEKSYQIVIEKAFKDVAENKQYLKSRTYGFINLYLAWKPLLGQDSKPNIAWDFLRKAIAYHPMIVFSKEFWRLNVSILFLKWFGADSYKRLLEITYSFRRRFIQLS